MWPSHMSKFSFLRRFFVNIIDLICLNLLADHIHSIDLYHIHFCLEDRSLPRTFSQKKLLINDALYKQSFFANKANCRQLASEPAKIDFSRITQLAKPWTQATKRPNPRRKSSRNSIAPQYVSHHLVHSLCNIRY